MGAWYTIGLCLGIGLGIGVVLVGVLGSNLLGAGVGAIVGAAIGAAIGLGIGGAAEATIAGVVGGFLGGLSAAAVVHGALRRGGTRIGIAAYVGVLGLLICMLALIPVLGYVEAVAIPLGAARRGRQAARFAGLRTLAK